MYKNLINILCSVTLLLTSNVIHANKITSYWSTHNNNNSESINHSSWNHFLQKYVNTENDNKVKYSIVNKLDKKKLEDYIKQLSNINPLTYSQKEQYAYWVNLYNAITINIILNHYPVSSIKKIKLGGSFFSFGPWKSPVITINDKTLSLDDIEHKILRPIWQDPRTHYAVNCASIGCPNLANNAFTSQNTEKLLSENARKFINSNKGVLINGNKVTLSKIYSWFKEDFNTAESSIIKHIMQYANKENIAALQDKKLNINYQYDWNLNDDK